MLGGILVGADFHRLPPTRVFVLQTEASSSSEISHWNEYGAAAMRASVIPAFDAVDLLDNWGFDLTERPNIGKSFDLIVGHGGETKVVRLAMRHKTIYTGSL